MSSDVQCTLCPKGCLLREGQRGDCRVRENRGGRLVSLVYGKPCAIHVDPIEKKPLFHVLPGSRSFSIATAGCNLHCKFCQNWEISQKSPEETRNFDMPPEKVVDSAEKEKCSTIAYTYSEPIVFYEYVMDTAVLAHKKNIRNILVTAGYINK
ncbi:MAG: radical SAM protein, partial [Candidatus Theseobacter exili]|nr:radical SAM protein [Candidatus Theseobacter exili]